MNPDNDEEKVTYLGETDARNRRLRFGIKRKDRAKHLYAIGKTGMGKSTLLENLAVQDILNGEGVCFLDPHGKSADLLMEYIPEHRIKDVIYFAPFDMDYPVSFNVMEDVGPEQRYLVASGMMSAFKKIWVDAWSARMEYILGNIMLALLEYPGSTLVAVNRMLTDKDFRKEVVSHISDPSVKSFWVNEYANYTEKFAAEAAPAIQNKVGQFVANPLIRNIIGQPKSSFDIRDVMDNKKILLINLSKGRVGEANANLLGSMLITKIYLGAMSRADLSEKELEAAPNFYLYVDEFQSFANESFADILSEARKYKLNLHIAHQYIEQMTDEVRAAVFGNVGTMCVFRVGSYDAEVIEKEFAPYFTAEDIVNLQKYQMYLKLMIDGVASQPFSASGLNPAPRPERSYTKEILASSRELYARPRQQVEEELLTWIQKKFGGGGGSGTSGGSNERSGGSSNGSGSASSNRGLGSSPREGGRDGGYAKRENGSSPSRGNASGSREGYGRDGGNGRDSKSRDIVSPRDGMGVRDGAGSSYRGASSVGPSSTYRSNLGSETSRPSGPRAEVSGPSTGVHTPSSNIQNTSKESNGTPVVQSNSVPTSPLSTISNVVPKPSAVPVSHAHQVPRNDQREQDLRKAMSLSYLKPEAPVHRDKTPKPENVAALRDALLSVMKTGGMIPNDSRNSSSNTENYKDGRAEKKAVSHTEHESEEAKHRKDQSHSHSHPHSYSQSSNTVSPVAPSKNEEPKTTQVREVDQSELDSIFAE